MNSQTINLLIPNGINNTKVYKKMTSPLGGFDIPRPDIKNLSNYSYINEHGGICFLFGDDKVYIGKSNSIVERINQHNRDGQKNFFDRCVAFTTENNVLTATHIDYLEYKFINKINENSTFNIINKDPRVNTPNITDFELPVIEELYDEINFVLKIMGIELYSNITKNDNVEDENIFMISYKNKPGLKDTRVDAYSIFEGSQIEILQGSIGRLQSNYIPLTEQLDKGNIQKIDDIHFEVVNNIKLAPSTASSIILGRGSSNGWVEWRLKRDSSTSLSNVYRDDD